MGILNLLDCCNRYQGDGPNTVQDYESSNLKTTPKRNNSAETTDTLLLVEEQSLVKEKSSIASPSTASLDPKMAPSTTITATCIEKDLNPVNTNINTPTNSTPTPQAVEKAVSFNQTDCDQARDHNSHASPQTQIPLPVKPPTAPKPPLIPINKDLAQLTRQCPDATPEERVRFLEAKDGDYKKAQKQLQAYLDWRKTNCMDKPIEQAASSRSTEDYQSCASFIVSEDENDWDVAAVAAMSMDPDQNRYKGAAFPRLPRLARFDDVDGNDRMLGVDGNRILQLLPARLDGQLATEETYALTIALYLDRQLDRNSKEKVTCFVDVRGGHGWSNPPARSAIPFIKGVIAILEQNFPERLAASIVCPMPFAAIALWRVIKVFLDPSTAKKIAVIRGSAERDSKLPQDKLNKYIDADVLAVMEKNRLSTCIDKKTNKPFSL